MKKIYLLALYSFVIPFSLIGQVYDFEGNKYDTVQIGSQVWLKQNTRSKRYWDGNEVSPNNYKCPNGDCSKVDSFGLLYNYIGLSKGETGKIVKGICPKGYAIPTPQNWHELMLYLDADTTWLWKNAYNEVKYKIIDKSWGGTGEIDLSFLPAGIYFNPDYNDFGLSTNVRLIDSNQHKTVYVTFDGGSAGTINVYNLAAGLVKADTYYQSCRCIKSDISTSSKNIEKSFDWKIYPNPCREEFSLSPSSELGIKIVELISINGQKFKLAQNQEGKYSTTDKPAGIYFVKISDQLNTKYIKLIIL